MTLPVGVGDQLARHRVGDDLHLAGLHRREDLHVARRVVRRGQAAAAALAAVVAGRAAVARHGRDRLARRYGANAELRAGALNSTSWALSAPGGLKMPSGALRMPSAVPGHADEPLSLVVVRREILVADRPVEAEAVGGLRLEVVVGHAQRDAAVVVGAPAENARSEPREVAAGRHRVRLALQLVAAVGRAVGEAGRSARVGLTPRRRRRDAAPDTATCAPSGRPCCSIGPASSSSTEMPRSASTLVTVPPPAPEPTTTTSWTVEVEGTCAMCCLRTGRGSLVHRTGRSRAESMALCGGVQPRLFTSSRVRRRAGSTARRYLFAGDLATGLSADPFVLLICRKDQAARTTDPADQRKKDDDTSDPSTWLHDLASRPHRRAACSGVRRRPGISLNSPRTRSMTF